MFATVVVVALKWNSSKATENCNSLMWREEEGEKKVITRSEWNVTTASNIDRFDTFNIFLLSHEYGDMNVHG